MLRRSENFQADAESYGTGDSSLTDVTRCIACVHIPGEMGTVQSPYMDQQLRVDMYELSFQCECYIVGGE